MEASWWSRSQEIEYIFRPMNLLRRLFFNLWYYRNPPWDTGTSPPELMDFIESHPPGRALDLGCGTGTNAITLSQHGWKTTGIDFASHAIRIARDKAQNLGILVDFRVEDVTTLENVTGSFDLVLDMGCFHSLSPKEKAIYAKELVHLLTPGGTYLMYGFFKPPTETGPGLVETDLDLLSDTLKLINRQDGTERGLRPSAWFMYQRP